MSFGDLYTFRQNLGIPLNLPEIRKKIRELLGRRVQVIKLDIDAGRLLGSYISPRNEDTLYYGAAPGVAVVVLSQHLDDDWADFVQLKELMHMFDDPLMSTNTPEEFERLISGLCENADPTKRSLQEQSEYDCFLMAVALACPETLRVELQLKRESKTMTDAEIAELLHIPERIVPAVFGQYYKENVAYLTTIS
jgi:hypothetical protein